MSTLKDGNTGSGLKLAVAAAFSLVVSTSYSCRRLGAKPVNDQTVLLNEVSCTISQRSAWVYDLGGAAPGFQAKPSLVHISGVVRNLSDEPLDGLMVYTAGNVGPAEWIYLPSLPTSSRDTNFEVVDATTVQEVRRGSKGKFKATGVEFEVVDVSQPGVTEILRKGERTAVQVKDADLQRNVVWTDALPGSYSGRVTVTIGDPTGRHYLGDGNPRDHPCFVAKALWPSSLPTQCGGRLHRGLVFEQRSWKDGDCYLIEKSLLGWVSPTRALWGTDKDRPVLVEFPSPPVLKLGINPTIAVKDGVYTYTNEFGASLTIPKLKVLDKLQLSSTLP